MPIDGTLKKTIHVPGKLFPVGSRNISNMPDLYTKNERLVCFFETAIGPLCVVMVGAALVGSIHTTWGGTINRRVGLEIKPMKMTIFVIKKVTKLATLNMVVLSSAYGLIKTVNYQKILKLVYL